MSLRAFTRTPGSGGGGGPYTPPAAPLDGLATDGVADDTAIFQAAVDAASDGATLVIPSGKVSRFAGTVTVTNKNLVIEGYGATIIQDSNVPLFNFVGTYGPTLAVSAITTVTRAENGTPGGDTSVLTLTTPVAWKHGDVVKLVSDDVIPEARPGSGGNESRLGEFATVREVTNGGLTVALGGLLRETFATNIRVALTSTKSVDFVGITFKVADPDSTTRTTSLVNVFRMAWPSVKDCRVESATGPAFIFASCYGYRVRNTEVVFNRNDPANNIYGYGVLDNSSSFGNVENLQVAYVRHAWTDDTNRIPANSSDLTHYGRSYGATINGTAQGTALAAWDTHQAGAGHTFLNCLSVNSHSAYGVQIRGRNHRVINFKGQALRGGILVAEEAAGGLTLGAVVSNPDLRDITGAAIAVSLAPTGHPTAGTRRTTTSLTVTGTALIRNVGTVADLTNGTVIFANGVDAETYTNGLVTNNSSVVGYSQPFQGGFLATGQETVHRQLVTNATTAMTSGLVRLARFTARDTRNVSALRIAGGTTAAAATPTLVKFGLYQVNDNGSLTLLAATANDTAVFAAASQSWSRNLTAPQGIVRGREYAIGAIVVTAATAPTICANAPVLSTSEMTQSPGFAWTVASQTDLPASIAAGSLTGSTATMYAVAV